MRAEILTSSEGRGKGKERSRTVSTTLKMAVLAPMPKARVKIATEVKPGFFRNMRRPKRTSCQKLYITKSRRSERRFSLDGQATNENYMLFSQRHHRQSTGPDSILAICWKA